MKRIETLCAVVASLCCLAATSQASIIQLYNTGVDALGVSLPNGTTPDPHYSLVSVPSGSSATVVLTSAGGFPIPPWLPNSPISAWISPNNGNVNNQSDPVGDYVFRTTFDLTGLDPSTAVITGGWSTDNAGTDIRLNGVSKILPAFQTAANQFQIGYVAFSLSGLGFTSGVNTLDFIVNNASGASGNPVGLRVEMTGTAAVPEPTTMVAGALLLLPFVASTLRMLRRRTV